MGKPQKWASHKSGQATKVGDPQKWMSNHYRNALHPIILPKKPQVLREPQMCIGATKLHHCHHSSAVRSCASCHSIGIYPSIYLPWKSLNPSPLENLCRVVSEVARALSRLTGATLTCAACYPGLTKYRPTTTSSSSSLPSSFKKDKYPLIYPYRFPLLCTM